jgi:hypothetical protein
MEWIIVIEVGDSWERLVFLLLLTRHPGDPRSPS